MSIIVHNNMKCNQIYTNSYDNFTININCSFKKGDVFEGTFNKNGLKHGIGRLRFADGSTYEGSFKDGFFHGLGTLVLTDRTKYEGIHQLYSEQNLLYLIT